MEAAHAHVDVQPALVEHGAVAELRVELPRLRPGPAPRLLRVTGAGVQLLDNRLLTVHGAESRWLVHVRVDAPPGPLRLTLRAVYRDGEAVEVKHALTVVPSSRDEGGDFPWSVAGIATLLATGLAVAFLRLGRRKAW